MLDLPTLDFSFTRNAWARRSLWEPGLGVAVVATFALLMPGAALAQFPGQSGYGENAFGLSEASLIWSRFVTILIVTVLGFMVGAFFSPALRTIRKYVLLGLLVLSFGFALFGPYPLADGASYLVAFACGLVAFAIGLRLGARVLESVAAAWRRPTSYGSAKWADLPYLMEHGVVGNTGFALGAYLEPGEGDAAPVSHPLHYAGARHLLTVAPTRSGKGVSSIIPNLLTYRKVGNSGWTCQAGRSSRTFRLSIFARNARSPRGHETPPGGQVCKRRQAALLLFVAVASDAAASLLAKGRPARRPRRSRSKRRENNMKIYSITELLALSRHQLIELYRELSRHLMVLSADTNERREALENLHAIRRVLYRPGPFSRSMRGPTP